MPVIYGNPGTGYVSKTEQPIYDPDAPKARTRPAAKPRKRPRHDLAVIRSDGKRYPSAEAAAADMGKRGSGSYIVKVCRGLRNLAYGYGWRYEDGGSDA